jgi:hypothetical protein
MRALKVTAPAQSREAGSNRTPFSTSAYAPEAALDLLAELVALHRQDVELQRQILAALERSHRPVSALSRSDRQVMERLLPAIAGALGSEQFTSRDLPDASPGLRVVLRDLSVKQIGRLLSRAEGVPIEGWIVERCGIEINVALWRVLASVSHRLESGTAIGRSGSISGGEPDA